MPARWNSYRIYKIDDNCYRVYEVAVHKENIVPMDSPVLTAFSLEEIKEDIAELINGCLNNDVQDFNDYIKKIEEAENKAQ